MACFKRSVALVCLLVSVAAGQGDPPSASELLKLLDPMKDDWVVEKLQSAASASLSTVQSRLSAGGGGVAAFEGIASKECPSTVLRSPGWPVLEMGGGFEVRRSPAQGPGDHTLVLSQAWNQMIKVLPGNERRFAFKVIGVSGAEKSWQTNVRFETFGRDPNRVVQQTGEIRLAWGEGDDGVARILSCLLLRFEETSRKSPAFVEATGSVLSGIHRPEEIALGSDWWHGRVDSVGESVLMGHQGLAVGDVNGDGREDLYVAMGTGLPNRLLISQEDGTVRDGAEAAGVAWLDDSKGVLFADMDNDGDQDLLCALGPIIALAKNDGKGRFKRVVGIRAVTPAAFYSLAVADYDLDGDLDIYGCRYVKVRYGVSIPMPFHDANNGPGNLMLRNEGEDRYTDVTSVSGLDANNTRFSLSAAWGDFDNDGDPDLYVANDFGRNNLYRNDGGRFSDVAAPAGVEDQAAGMGVSWGDFDNDGDLDLYVTNMFSAAGNRIAYQSRFKVAASSSERAQIQDHSLGNSLLVNQGDGTFRPAGDESGVRMARWGWGSRFVDIDDDGAPDLVAPNGFLTGRRDDDL